MNIVKEIDVKNRTYDFRDDMINVENLDPYKIKIAEKSYKNILIYYIGYVTVKDLSYVTTNSIKLLYLIISKLMVTFRKVIFLTVIWLPCGQL